MFWRAAGLSLIVFAGGILPGAAAQEDDARTPCARMLAAYYDAMSTPKPFLLREGDDLATHRDVLRGRLLADIGLDPLPERIPLDIHRSAPIDHTWCTIQRIEFQLWPGIYSSGLLYMPKTFQEQPAPAVLCPHGHWDHGYAHADVQKRCLTLAWMGYVVLSTRQNHMEDLPYGLSHQTLMVWTNMRGVDVLQSLQEVDEKRIGAAGASGGGLQTQMITALDERIQAAVIVGLTCDFREIMFPHGAHCGCNHFPNFMAYTDFPEIASMAFPRSIQFLTMNDWTRHFIRDNFPDMAELYRRNGMADCVACTYWPTPHTYDRPKRERTYWWMEKWLRHGGDVAVAIPEEPEDIQTVFPVEVLENLPVENSANKGIEALPEYFRTTWGFTCPELDSVQGWRHWRGEMCNALPALLGLDRSLEPATEGLIIAKESLGGVVTEELRVPSEGPLSLPAKMLCPEGEKAPWPIALVLSEAGCQVEREALAQYREQAGEGHLIVLADVRFSGAYSLPDLAGLVSPELSIFDWASPRGMSGSPEGRKKDLLWAWERNGVCWGRPLPGMTVTDIQAVLGYLEERGFAMDSGISIETRGLSHLGLAALLAAALDSRITAVDVDLCGADYVNARPFCEDPDQLPVIPFLMRYGGPVQWAGTLADRSVRLRNLAKTETEGAWLHALFSLPGNGGELHLDAP